MTRPLTDYLNVGAFVTETSEAVIRARAEEYREACSPARRMSDTERRENLLALAECVLREEGWAVPAVVRPSWLSHAAKLATTEDFPAFGRLLLAVRDHDPDAAAKALLRLVPAVAA